MHNLKTVISFEFFRSIKKWSFWVSILAIPIIIGVVGGLSYLSASSAIQHTSENASQQIAILDRSGIVEGSVLGEHHMTTVPSKEEGVREVRAGELQAFFYYPKSPVGTPIEIYAKDRGLIKNSSYSSEAKELLRESVLAGIQSQEELAIINKSGDIRTDVTAYKNGEVVLGFGRVIAPGIFLVLFYLIIVLMGNEMLSSTTEEKENRVIEMILTTVSSKTLLFGKIISLVLLAILRISVILIPTILGFLYFSGGLGLPPIHISLAPVPIIIGAVLFVLSFLLFTGLLVTVGAAMPTAKESARFFGLTIFSMFIPLYAVTAIISDPGQIIVKIFSFFPTTAPVTLLLRNAVGNLALWELALGLFILAVSTVIILLSATRAFRYGALEYSRRLHLKEILGLK